MKKLKLALIASALLVGGFSAQAQTIKPLQVAKADKDTLTVKSGQEFAKKLNAKYPKLKAHTVSYLEDLKLYEFASGLSTQLAYTNEDMSFFMLNNQFIDPVRFSLISEERNYKFLANLVKQKTNPNEIQAVFGDKNAKDRRHLLIFTDPYCPYCQSLDKELHDSFKNENVTITYYMNPLWEIPGHEKGMETASKIWCSDNKNQAWKDWMLNQKMPSNAGTCTNPVKEHSAFARHYEFTITPVVLFDNGFIYRGKPTVEEIRRELNTPNVKPDNL